jgi:hypothetical protein
MAKKIHYWMGSTYMDTGDPLDGSRMIARAVSAWLKEGKGGRMKMDGFTCSHGKTESEPCAECRIAFKSCPSCAAKDAELERLKEIHECICRSDDDEVCFYCRERKDLRTKLKRQQQEYCLAPFYTKIFIEDLQAEIIKLREELMDTRENTEWAIRELDAYGHITAANTLRRRAKMDDGSTTRANKQPGT